MTNVAFHPIGRGIYGQIQKTHHLCVASGSSGGVWHELQIDLQITHSGSKGLAFHAEAFHCRSGSSLREPVGKHFDTNGKRNRCIALFDAWVRTAYKVFMLSMAAPMTTLPPELPTRNVPRLLVRLADDLGVDDEDVAKIREYVEKVTF